MSLLYLALFIMGLCIGLLIGLCLNEEGCEPEEWQGILMTDEQIADRLKGEMRDD